MKVKGRGDNSTRGTPKDRENKKQKQDGDSKRNRRETDEETVEGD